MWEEVVFNKSGKGRGPGWLRKALRLSSACEGRGKAARRGWGSQSPREKVGHCPDLAIADRWLVIQEPCSCISSLSTPDPNEILSILPASPSPTIDHRPRHYPFLACNSVPNSPRNSWLFLIRHYRLRLWNSRSTSRSRLPTLHQQPEDAFDRLRLLAGHSQLS